MSSAKRTPRYVERIPTNIRIVGPTVEAQVIPIRRVTPAYTPVIDAPFAAPRRKPARLVPVEQRPWQVLVVSPRPGSATRMVRVARWHARVVIGTLLVLFLTAGGAVAALVVAVQSPDLFVTSADAAELREQLLSMEDSLSVARDELAEANDAAKEAEDSAAAAVTALAKASTRPAPAARTARRPSLTHEARMAARSAARAADPDLPELAPRSIDGLPAVGRLASGFSRARRHPILHITRAHLGLDIAAPRGTPVTAPAPGRVSFLGRKFGFGLVVEITHAEGVVTRYAHLRSFAVTEGARVTRGQVIAAVGSTGITTGPHLHYEILVRGRQVDPLRFRVPQGDAATPVPPAQPPAPTAWEPSDGPEAGGARQPAPSSNAGPNPAAHVVPSAGPASSEPPDAGAGPDTSAAASR